MVIITWHVIFRMLKGKHKTNMNQAHNILYWTTHLQLHFYTVYTHGVMQYLACKNPWFAMENFIFTRLVVAFP